MELVKSLREEVVRDWQRLGLDAVIAPAMGCTPLPLGWTKYTMGALTYTSAFNMLNFPAGSMPVTTVQPQDLEVPFSDAVLRLRILVISAMRVLGHTTPISDVRRRRTRSGTRGTAWRRVRCAARRGCRSTCRWRVCRGATRRVSP